MCTCVNMDISFLFLPEALHLPSIHATLCAHYLASNHCLALPVCSAQPRTKTTPPLAPTPVCLYFLRQDQKFPSPVRPWGHESRFPDLCTKHLAYSNFSVNTEMLTSPGAGGSGSGQASYGHGPQKEWWALPYLVKVCDQRQKHLLEEKEVKYDV